MRTLLLCFAVLVLSLPTAWGTTTLLLKDGGTLEGELLNPDEISRKLYHIKTSEGLEIRLDAQLVDRIQARQREALIEYNNIAPLTQNTIENHVAWARWCSEQQLADQARTHWQQVLELEPDHIDARRVLGYRQTQNGWESDQNRLENQGFVQDRGRWRTRHEADVVAFLENQRNAERDWQRTISTLYRRLPNPQAEAELRSIYDPVAFVPIRDLLLNESNPHRRLMLLGILAQMPDARALQFVAGWSIRPEESDDIRRLCIEELQRRSREMPEIRQHMIAVYRSALRSNAELPVIVLATRALGEIRGHEAVPELIEALIFTRTETIQSPTPTYTFGSGGTGMGQGGKPTTRSVDEPNQEVLSVLVRLTGVNFDYNQPAWRNWYRQSYRSPTLNLRRY